MWVMAKRNALIRKLNAVETLGATRIIFTDKTGTLTKNRMALRTVDTSAGSIEIEDDAEPSGADDARFRRVLEIGVLCNNAIFDGSGNEDSQGDPMEVALLEAGKRFGMKRDEMLEEKPEQREVSFDPGVMMMATYHKDGDGYDVMVKGAEGAVLESCTTIAESDAETREFTDEERAKWQERCDDLAGKGLRILAFADKHTDSTDAEPYEELRFVGLLDPPREDVRDAIDECERAGIRVVMVTGDQPRTAEAIASKSGLGEPDEELTVMPLPLLPLQILFLNLLTDVFPALALGVNKGSDSVMDRPPREPGEAVLTAKQWKAIAGWSVLIAACVLGTSLVPFVVGQILKFRQTS